MKSITHQQPATVSQPLVPPSGKLALRLNGVGVCCCGGGSDFGSCAIGASSEPWSLSIGYSGLMSLRSCPRSTSVGSFSFDSNDMASLTNKNTLPKGKNLYPRSKIATCPACCSAELYKQRRRSCEERTLKF